jgi:hypothetical protein
VGLGLCGLLARLPADGLGTPWRTSIDSEAITAVLGAPWRALVPVPRLDAHWWNSNALARSPEVAMLLGVALVVLIAYVLRRHTGAVVVWASATTAAILATYTRGLPLATRQEGTLYLAFVAATWLACSSRDRRPEPSIRTLVAVVFAVQAIVGLATFSVAGSRDFTDADAAATWISRHEADDVVLVGDNAAILSSVAYRLDRPIVIPEKPSGEPFVVWKRSLEPGASGTAGGSAQRAALELARRIARDGDHPVVLVLGAPMASGTGAHLDAHFDDGIEVDEHYWIYTP